ncbi:MAG: slipin family protein [Pseudomonadota bacterium]
MFLFTNHIVRKHERGLLFHNGDFKRFLDPGKYRFFNWRGRYTVQRFDIATPRFQHPLTDYLVTCEADATAERLEVVSTGANEVAVISYDGRPAQVLGPAQRRLYWKGVVALGVERFDIEQDVMLDLPVARRLFTAHEQEHVDGLQAAVNLSVVQAGCAGLLYVEGELVKSLAAGTYAFWRLRSAVRLEQVDTRVRTLDVSGQEILTRDKVSLRINVTATYQVRDAQTAWTAAKDPLDHLYKEVQFALRAVVGTRTLDALLEDKEAINHSVLEGVKARFAAIGIEVLGLGVKDIILPGEMKSLLGQVVEAEKAAQANVIRRREETNATRSLLNTAKVMESNSVALRLKELETLEKVTEKIGSLSVHTGAGAGLESLLSDLVRLKQ